MKVILIFLLFFFVNNSNNTTNYTSPFDEQELQKICSKCRSGFNDTYINEELLNKISDKDKINKYVKKVVELLKTDKTDKLKDEYVTPRVINPNIIFIVLIVFLILIWIALIVLVCLNKKIFKFEHNQEQTHLGHHLLAYITVLFFIIIIILSSISLSYVSKSQTYFNGVVCSLFRIYIDLRDGDQAHTSQWEGIRNLQNDLVGDKNIVNKILTEINEQEEITNELLNNKYEKMTFASNEKDKGYYSNIEVPSPDPSSLLSNVKPKYSKNREDDINQIEAEYILKLKHGVEVNEKIKDKNIEIKKDDKLSAITRENLFINSQLNEMLETVQITAEEYLQIAIDYIKYANSVVFPILYSIFSLSIIFSVLGIVIILLNYKNKLNLTIKKIFSIILHILWNFILLLLLFTIISQIIFKIFEIFGEDGSGLLQYATSKENFESSDSVIFKGAGNAFLETCFNDKNGDLLAKIISKMGDINSWRNDLNELALDEIALAIYSKEFEKIKLGKTQEIVSDLENMLNDYSLIPYFSLLIEKKCQSVFDDLNKVTDFGQITTEQSLLSEKHSYDKWVSIKKNCEQYSGYKYIEDQKYRIEGNKNKYCMVLEKFDKEVAKNFYSQIKLNDLTTPNADEKFDKFYDSLDNFRKENQKLLSEDPNFVGLTKKYYNELLALKERILEGLKKSEKIVDYVHVLVGNSNNVGYDLSTLMNCNFLKRDLKVFYYEMEDLRVNSNPYITLTFFVLIFLLTTAILIILNIYKYKKEENDEQIDKLSTDSINIEK